MPKILIQDGLSANHFIRLAWMNAFSLLGHQVYLWNKEAKSAFDIFYEFKPDIFIGDTYQITPAIVKNLVKYSDTKCIFCASQWGPHNAEVDPKEFPLLFINDDEKRLMESLKKQTGNPDYVFNYYADKYADYTHGDWRELGIEPVGLPLSADITEYYLTNPSANYKADIVVCGGYWPYKAKTIAPYLFPLLYPNTNADIKIFGNGVWPTPQYLGMATSDTIRNFYASAKVCPNFFEPHSLKWGYDLNSRLFQICACGGFQISQRVASIEEDIYTDDEIVFADNPEDFITKTIHYMKNPDFRVGYVQRAVKETYAEHTNLHRAGTILKLLGLEEDAAKAAKLAEELYNNVVPKIFSTEWQENYVRFYE